MATSSPFHQGELDVQKITGEYAKASRLSRLIQNMIPESAYEFIRQLAVIWIGIEGQDGFLWAFPLLGSPGFIHVQNNKQIKINLMENYFIPNEWKITLQQGKAIASLSIDFSKRSRLRMNGFIREVNKTHLVIDIQQVYPNCSKYIRKRSMEWKTGGAEFTLACSGRELNAQMKNIINRSETAFVASQALNGADISHRGGSRGFIKNQRFNTIRVPDYQGNSMFNTLGNFKINPQGGLLIVDFNRGHFLQIFGKVNLSFDIDQSGLNTSGSQRFWELEIRKYFVFQFKSNFKWHDS